MLTVGEALVDLLEQYGVDTVFGIPGTHSIELYRGLEKSRIRHVLPRHEQGGGFMADGYARKTGKPGVCFVITGAGVTNITTPMGEAYMDSVPMLVISPVNPPDAAKVNRGRLHEITDQSAVTAPLTAFSATVHHAEQIPELLAKAFTIFASERPLPVHISIPLPIMGQTIAHKWRKKSLPEKANATAVQLAKAAQMIGQAENPLIIAGGGSRFAADEVTKFAELAAIEVTTTVAGRGVIPASHPLAVGAQLRTTAVKQLAKHADLLILLGTELAQTDHWDDELPEQITRQQIRVNLNADSLLVSEDGLAIKADVAGFLQQLTPLLIASTAAALEHAKSRIAAVKDRLYADLTEKEQLHLKVINRVMSELPDDLTIVSDMTQLAYTAIDFVPLERANSWFHPTGYGTLGYGLPAGMGAAIAANGSPVLVIVGDAGLQYTIQELTLAAELDLNLVVLLWNNDALAQIRDDMVNADIDPLAITQKNPDFIKLAEACGCAGVVVNDLQDLAGQVKAAIENVKQPVIIQVNEYEVSQ